MGILVRERAAEDRERAAVLNRHCSRVVVARAAVVVAGAQSRA